jgi:hypothetical protein
MPFDLRTIPLLLVLIPGVGCGDRNASDAAADSGEAVEPSVVMESADDGIVVAGFSGPESVVHDTRADVYLVSNINGQALDADGNGFISRVSPDGTISNLKWIDGEADGVTLNAPKGLGLYGDTLIVTDIDVVRLFDRNTGARVGEWAVDGSTFLNDVAVASDGTIYVSDSGVRFGESGPEDTGSAAIHVFGSDGSHRKLDAGDVSRINGIAERDGRVIGVGSFGSGAIFSVIGGNREELPLLPGVDLDGVIVMDDGTLLISDWTTQSVYLLRPNGSASAVVRNVESPADIGIDRRRNRLLIPGLTTNQVLLAPIPG